MNLTEDLILLVHLSTAFFIPLEVTFRDRASPEV